MNLIELKPIIEERLRNKTIVDPNTGCWLFNGTLKNGRGIIIIDYHPLYVHRVSAALYLGYDLLDNILQVNHKDDKCSNINCWNPEHLYIGTKQENVHDAIIKGTHNINRHPNSLKTHCKYGHEYNEENTYINGKGGRICRICHRERERRLR